MTDLKNKPKEISNPDEFRKLFLSDSKTFSCPAGNRNHHFHFTGEKSSFLEIRRLEELKALHKQKAFESTRRNFYTIVLLTAGNVKETIGHNTYEFGAGTLYFIPENQLHTIHKWSADIKGYHCIFDADYFLLCLKNQVKLSEYPFLQPDTETSIRLSVAESGMLEHLFKKMQFEYCMKKSLNDDLLIRLYLNVFLIEAERIYQHQKDIEQTSFPRREQLVAKFRKMVSHHFINLKQVTDYAERLYVTPHYLNDTVRELTGKPASRFIYDQIITEAKAQLIQTDDTITQIAANLNFADQSYFCRFFKKHTGMSPVQFRREHHHKS